MKKRITIGISFPDAELLEKAKERAASLGIRSFSDYINQLIRLDLGMPNYIGAHANTKKRGHGLTMKNIQPNQFEGIEDTLLVTGSAKKSNKVKNK